MSVRVASSWSTLVASVPRAGTSTGVAGAGAGGGAGAGASRPVTVTAITAEATTATAAAAPPSNPRDLFLVRVVLRTIDAPPAVRRGAANGATGFSVEGTVGRATGVPGDRRARRCLISRRTRTDRGFGSAGRRFVPAGREAGVGGQGP